MRKDWTSGDEDTSWKALEQLAVTKVFGSCVESEKRTEEGLKPTEEENNSNMEDLWLIMEAKPWLGTKLLRGPENKYRRGKSSTRKCPKWSLWLRKNAGRVDLILDSGGVEESKRWYWWTFRLGWLFERLRNG